MNFLNAIPFYAFGRTLSLFDLIWLMLLSALGGWYWLLWIPLVMISAAMQRKVEHEPNH